MSSPRGTKRGAADLIGADDGVAPPVQLQRLSGEAEDSAQVELAAARAHIAQAEKDLEAQLSCPLTQARKGNKIFFLSYFLHFFLSESILWASINRNLHYLCVLNIFRFFQTSCMLNEHKFLD